MSGSIRALALALAGMGDTRALPTLRELAKQDRLPSGGAWTPILAPMPAADLLPVLLPGLRPAREHTHDPSIPTFALLAAVDPAWTGNPALPTREAVRLLGEIGAPAAAAAPVLRTVLASEERLDHPYDGVRVLADETYVRTLAGALERIDPGGAQLRKRPSAGWFRRAAVTGWRPVSSGRRGSR
ncbi:MULTISPECIES: hypothetical protein [unclassified Streptomyces]|uniref:hypothetical protein n=1 Tax=unclassified Streptomyces TaxID=2593676 RepID=UPI000DC775D1|nr:MULTISPECIES: hypothetical protein [unclassified Streptomyces]AWZ08570.1 hypothetical protein DRB89_32790 [Streptomyces sp. ICC4]AWZ17190.1 hypothetical protein DRB96_39260 [Streptomyces sp. ICC1]